jgi:hypothetical protein
MTDIPPTGNIAEVMAWVSGDVGRAQAALTAERHRPDGSRSTLVADLEKVVATPASAAAPRNAARKVRVGEVYVTDPETRRPVMYVAGDVPAPEHLPLLGDHVFRAPPDAE